MRPNFAIGLVAVCLPVLAESPFILGLDYSNQIGDVVLPSFSNNTLTIAADAQGNAYVMIGPSIFKCAATGRVIWQVSLSTSRVAMAVDAVGNLYVLAGQLLQRISSDGKSVTSLMDFGNGVVPEFVAIDTGNRIWIAGYTNPGVSNPIAATPGAFQQSLPSTTYSHIFIARLNTAGKVIEYATYLAGSGQDDPAGITVDGTDAVIITGTTSSADFPLTAGSPSSGQSAFLTRFKPDGTGLIYSILLPQYPPSSPAATPQGEAVLAIPGPFNEFFMLVYAPNGTPVFQREVPDARTVAVDAAGNIYAAGAPASGNAPTKNSIATCLGSFLSVFSPSGDTLQATWLPASVGPSPTLAVAGSRVYFAALHPGSNITPVTLSRLSQHPDAATFPLACLTDAAVFQIPGVKPPYISFYSNTPTGITPGEIVSLFGERLGPAVGVQPSITTDARFPKELSSVQVLFDGQSARLPYVQDSQINAVAPWSLTPGKNTQVCVTYSGAPTNCLSVPVVASAPAVFTVDGTHVAAVNQDGTINSQINPAPPGSIVAVFATGLGPTTPALADGAITQFPLPQNQFQVTANTVAVSAIGTDFMPWDVTYYGPAPFEVAGLSQVNLRVSTLLPDALTVQTVYLHVANVVGEFSIFTGKP